MSNIDDNVPALFDRFKQSPYVFLNAAGDPNTTAYESQPPGIYPGGFIDDGAISLSTMFADTIRPVAVVTSLPALPDASYPVGSFAFLTTDAKLYRNTDGSTWSKAVDGGDLAAGTVANTALVADSITAGEIAAGAISTSELAASAVTADKIAAASITADKLYVGDFRNLVQDAGFERDTSTNTSWAN